MLFRLRVAVQRFGDDESASTAGAAIPMFLAVLGLLTLAAGAILAMAPLLVLGGGFVVVAAAVYMISAALDRSDRRRAADVDRAAAARRDFEADKAALPTAARSPLADAAVAALTGAADAGGVFPPLGQAAPRAVAASPVPVWDPDVREGEPWQGDAMMEFVAADAPMEAAAPRRLAVAGAGGATEEMPALAATAGRDFRAWPGTKGLDAWATFTGERKPQKNGLTDKDIRAAMDERRRVIADRLPTVGAILSQVGPVPQDDDEEAGPPRSGMTRGKCSKCESVLWAPLKRPILLKCPGCGHKAKLF